MFSCVFWYTRTGPASHENTGTILVFFFCFNVTELLSNLAKRSLWPVQCDRTAFDSSETVTLTGSMWPNCFRFQRNGHFDRFNVTKLLSISTNRSLWPVQCDQTAFDFNETVTLTGSMWPNYFRFQRNGHFDRFNVTELLSISTKRSLWPVQCDQTAFDFNETVTLTGSMWPNCFQFQQNGHFDSFNGLSFIDLIQRCSPIFQIDFVFNVWWYLVITDYLPKMDLLFITAVNTKKSNRDPFSRKYLSPISLIS